MKATRATPDREIVTERLINAPRDLVFAAWTDPEQVAKWWGPNGFTNTIHEMDVRPGGRWRSVMHGPDGTDYENEIVFVNVVKPELIVYDHVSTPKFRNTVTFVAEGSKTRLTMRGVFEDPGGYEMAVKTFGAVEGGKQTLGRLAEFVEARPRTLELGPLSEVSLKEKDGVYTVTLVRDLAHSRETVWAALTDPLHLKEWSPFVADRNLAAVGKATLTMIGADTESFNSTVIRAEAPLVLEYTWDEDVLRFELEPAGQGTRLILHHSMKDKGYLAGVSAGWHICLVLADLFMQGRPFGNIAGPEAKKHGWDRLNEAYAAKLGVPKMVSRLSQALRKIVLFMHVSLDGYVAGPKGEMDWIHVDDEIFEYAGARTNEGDTALYGRVTYEMMEAYWPTAADQPNASKHNIEHSRWYNRVEKVVLSRSLKGTTRPKTRIVSENLVAEIQSLKASPGREILIFGSPGAAHSLMAEDLVDGYWLFVNPLLLGEGLPLFADVKARRPLRLVESKTLSSGVVCLHYVHGRAT